LLVRYFVQIFSRRLNKTVEYVPAEAMDALVNYGWPGNIRELENLIERAVLLSPGKELRVPISELSRQRLPRTATSPPTFRYFRRRRFRPITTLEEAERPAHSSRTASHRMRIAGPKGAAAILGMKRTTLQARMRKLVSAVLSKAPGIAARTKNIHRLTASSLYRRNLRRICQPATVTPVGRTPSIVAKIARLAEVWSGPPRGWASLVPAAVSNGIGASNRTDLECSDSCGSGEPESGTR